MRVETQITLSSFILDTNPSQISIFLPASECELERRGEQSRAEERRGCNPWTCVLLIHRSSGAQDYPECPTNRCSSISLIDLKILRGSAPYFLFLRGFFALLCFAWLCSALPRSHICLTPHQALAASSYVHSHFYSTVQYPASTPHLNPG